MPSEDVPMPFLSSIGFSITKKCPVACSHCIIEAGPNMKEEMSLDDIYDWMQQAANYRNGYIQSIVLTGGEPFYNLEKLEKILEYAIYFRLIPAVVTNAFWADSLSGAIRNLERLSQIKMLTISTDVYHQRFIPFENVKNAVLAAEELGIKYNLAVCFENENDDAYLRMRNELKEIVSDDLVRVSAAFPAGRAQKNIKPGKISITKNPPVSACTAADFATIFPDGRVVGCMGILTDMPAEHPLSYGNLHKESLEYIFNRAEMNTALHIIRLWGPGKLIKMLQDTDLKERVPKKYLEHRFCDFCYALLSDSELIAKLQEITHEYEITEKTAYARMYYFKEEIMLDMMKKCDTLKT